MLNISQLATVYSAAHSRQKGSARRAKAILGEYLGYHSGIGAKAAELQSVLEEIENHTQCEEIKRMAMEIAAHEERLCRQCDEYIANWKSKVIPREFAETMLRHFKPEDVQFILETITILENRND